LRAKNYWPKAKEKKAVKNASKTQSSFVNLALAIIFVFFASGANAATLNVLPFELWGQNSGTCVWTSADKHTGGSSASMATINTAGSQSGLKFIPPALTIDGLTSVSFWYKHASDAGSAGPRIVLKIKDGSNYYLVISGAAATSITWQQANGVTGDNLTTTGSADQVWWYGTCNADGSGYAQTAGPVNLAAVQSALNGDIEYVSVYMGVVEQGASEGSAYVDDAEINSVVYYGKIQDAIDTASRIWLSQALRLI